MRNTLGDNLTLTIYGESHGISVGCILDGMPSGIKIDEEFIKHQLSLRRPQGTISTSRVELDEYKIKSGVFNGYTTGEAICIDIPNNNTHSSDYSDLSHIARPSHADYVAYKKYDGFNDYRGGGHFSGRLTTPIVVAGAIVLSYLKDKGIYIGSHIKESLNIKDDNFNNYLEDINYLNNEYIAMLNKDKKEELLKKIEEVASKGDSCSGKLETVIYGLPVGVGEPYFDSLESKLAHGLFSIGAVKGVEFGLGFDYLNKLGSEVNDSFKVENDKVITTTNNNGGINGGISNGMPVLFSTIIKPTPSIFKPQDTIDFKENKNINYQIKGRHDPAIFHRARVVIDSISALVVMDLLLSSNKELI